MGDSFIFLKKRGYFFIKSVNAGKRGLCVWFMGLCGRPAKKEFYFVKMAAYSNKMAPYFIKKESYSAKMFSYFVKTTPCFFMTISYPEVSSTCASHRLHQDIAR